MLKGRQLYLLRNRDTKITDKELAQILNISVNEILIYEYDKKPIPIELYMRWEGLLSYGSLLDKNSNVFGEEAGEYKHSEL